MNTEIRLNVENRLKLVLLKPHFYLNSLEDLSRRITVSLKLDFRNHEVNEVNHFLKSH